MTRAPAPHAVRRGVAALALALLVPGLASGCSTASDVSPPAGVDELTVPTPSPDPADFVSGIDNPWLPLEPGARFSYAVGGGPGGGLEVTVAEETTTVADVEATVVETTSTVTAGGDGAGRHTQDHVDYYAQDTRGNVWWLGREGEWQAGEDGAVAGIAMLAIPRQGDGYREALLDGVVERTSEVVALDGEVETRAGAFEEMVVIDVTDPLEGSVRRAFYARGAGLVYEETRTGAPDETLALL